MVLNEGLGLYRVCRRKNDRRFIGAASLPPATFGEAIDLILIIIVLLLLFGGESAIRVTATMAVSA